MLDVLVKQWQTFYQTELAAPIEDKGSQDGRCVTESYLYIRMGLQVIGRVYLSFDKFEALRAQLHRTASCPIDRYVQYEPEF
jgi:hypothetical protein